MLKSKDEKPVTYVGYTSNLKNRIKLHNQKRSKIYPWRKWKLIFKEKLATKIKQFQENII